MSPAVRELATLAQEWQRAERADAFGMGGGSMATYDALQKSKLRFLAAAARLRSEELADALVELANYDRHAAEDTRVGQS